MNESCERQTNGNTWKHKYDCNQRNDRRDRGSEGGTKTKMEITAQRLWTNCAKNQMPNAWVLKEAHMERDVTFLNIYLNIPWNIKIAQGHAEFKSFLGIKINFRMNNLKKKM